MIRGTVKTVSLESLTTGYRSATTLVLLDKWLPLVEPEIAITYNYHIT